MVIDFIAILDDVFNQQTNTICLKFREASKIYCSKNPTENEEKILKHTDALLFKFTLAVINLEFLWKISELKIDPSKDGNQEDYFEWNNKASIIDSSFLENTIIQIRAFIDFAQKLSCVVLGYTKPIDNTKKFYKTLNKIGSKKSSIIEQTFKEVDNSWGELIRSLRDKIVHYDLIKTGHEFRPTLRNKNYEQFAQDLTNNMFYLLIELNQKLFEVDWVSGTFEEFKNKYDR
jgi:hypothetical protein